MYYEFNVFWDVEVYDIGIVLYVLIVYYILNLWVYYLGKFILVKLFLFFYFYMELMKY